MATQPPHVGTIGDKIRIGHGIWINCLNQECLHRAKMDLAALAERLGANFPVAELVKRAVCSECGSRWPRLSITVAVENAPRVIPKRETE
jgi:hypothetical protein